MADYFDKYMASEPEDLQFNPQPLPPEEQQQLYGFLLNSPWLTGVYDYVSQQNPNITREGLLSEMLANGSYDYASAYEGRGSDMFAIDPASGTYHGSSRNPDGKWLKSPDHPTTWKEVFYTNSGFSPDTSYSSPHRSMGRAEASDFMMRNYPGLLDGE